MEKLCTVPVSMAHFNGDVNVYRWYNGDTFPVKSSSVGVDTETELITDSNLAPPVVVLGVFDPEAKACYVIYWRDIPAFMTELCSRDIEQRYFNLGFDEAVIDNEDNDRHLLDAIDSNRVVDMQIRAHIDDISRIGYIRSQTYSLAGCTLLYENFKLDKGDGTEDSARLSFRRYNQDGTDYVITEEQARYLPFDCISTWCLGEAIKRTPVDPFTGVSVEYAHVKGMVALAHISQNGFPVDNTVFEAFEKKLRDGMDHYRNLLLTFDFPDPYKDATDEAKQYRENLMHTLQEVLDLSGCGYKLEIADPPNKECLKYVILILYMYANDPYNMQDFYSDLEYILRVDRGKLKKKEQAVFDTICDTYGLAGVLGSKRALILQVYVMKMLESAMEQIKAAENGTYAFEALIEHADVFLASTPSLTDKTKIGPKKFFQLRAQALLDKYPGLELKRTDKSNDIKLTLKDMWRLADVGAKDRFLEAYTGFKHCEKLKSTYVNRDYICSDGKVHPKFNSVVRTGRTSCVRPNIQNYPSHDSLYPMKNMFKAPEGAVLCATDFSFLELCSFAQSCYSRFGRSVMKDVINAGLDPHRWFAGVKAGVISSSTEFTKNPDAVKEMSKFLKENITKEARQFSKEANFGFPGGMSVNRFWEGCREKGMCLSKELAGELREKWIDAFPEMKQHMVPKELRVSHTVNKFYGMNEGADEEEIDEEENNGKLYESTLITGMHRTRCSYCSALNFQFQGLAANGMKLSMWNIVMAGYIDRVVSMIHDELVYWLYPGELKTNIPVIEDCMIRGMRTVLPDINVKVETSCMLHWDKEAIPYTEIENWDSNGYPILEEPEFVKQAYGLTDQK